jgi:hypothetical protein
MPSFSAQPFQAQSCLETLAIKLSPILSRLTSAAENQPLPICVYEQYPAVSGPLEFYLPEIVGSLKEGTIPAAASAFTEANSLVLRRSGVAPLKELVLRSL